MSGFGFYETLRVFVPGVIAVLILDVLLRLMSGDSPFVATGGMKDVLDALETPPVYGGASLVAGLLLYQLDLPTKMRIYREGDPDRGIRLPSDLVKQAFEGRDAPGHPLSIYFILSDAYLSDALHRRIYLFGSLYRIYVDLRIMLALSLAIGPAIWLYALAGESGFTLSRPISMSSVGAVLSIGVGAIAFGLAETLTYLERKHRKQPSSTRWSQIWLAARQMGPVVAVESALILVGSWAAASGVAPLQAVGVAVAFVGFMVWLSVDVGPLGAADDDTVRARMLARILPSRRGSQYPPTYRLAADLGVVVTAIGLASLAGANAGRSATALLAWSVLALPMTAILGYRKHEERLIAVYGDQSTWLKLHWDEVEHIAATGRIGNGRLSAGAPQGGD